MLFFLVSILLMVLLINRKKFKKKISDRISPNSIDVMPAKTAYQCEKEKNKEIKTINSKHIAKRENTNKNNTKNALTKKHLSLQMRSSFCSRSSGNGAVDQAAYRAGEKFTDKMRGKEFDHSKKSKDNDTHSKILDRDRLLNSVQENEILSFTLPREIYKERNMELVKPYIENRLFNLDIPLDYLSIHWDEVDFMNVNVSFPLRPSGDKSSFKKITPHIPENLSSLEFNEGQNISALMEEIQNELYLSQEVSNTNKPMIPLLTTYEDKDIVKELGGLWCRENRGWFWPHTLDRELIKDWLPIIYHPDRTSPYIFPDLVPQPLWKINLRSLLSSDEWDRLRKQTYKEHAYRCTICGCKGKGWPVECDEKWGYTMNSEESTFGEVKFLGLTALCPGCHQIKHFGKATVDGLADITFARMCYLNEWDTETTKKFIDDAYSTWEVRSAKGWNFDFSHLKKAYGIELSIDSVAPLS